MSDALTKLKQAHRILGETIAEMEGLNSLADAGLSNAIIGPCTKCGENFEAGQPVLHVAEGDRFMHAMCPRDVEEARKKRMIGTALEDSQKAPSLKIEATSGHCATCGEGIYGTGTGKPFHVCPPAWLRGLHNLHEERWNFSHLTSQAEYEKWRTKLNSLEALAKLRAVVLSGNTLVEIPDSVAKHLSVAGSEEPSPSGFYYRKESWPEYWVYQGESERWPGGVTETTTRLLNAIDAAGAEIIK